MRLIFRFIVLLAVLGVAAEIVAPSMVESRIEDRVRERSRGTVGVEAEVDSFPMLTRLALTGTIKRLDIRLSEVARRKLVFSSISYELEGVKLDRDAALRGQARLRDIDRGSITAELSAEDLAAGFGVPLDLAPGDVTVRVRDRVLELAEGAAAGLSETLPDDVLPCDPQARATEGMVVLTCTFTDIPPILVRAAEQAALEL